MKKEKRKLNAAKLGIINLLMKPKVKLLDFEVEHELLDLTTMDSKGFEDWHHSGIQHLRLTIYKKPKKEKIIPGKVEKTEMGTVKFLLNDKIVFIAVECILIREYGDRNESCPDPHYKGWEVHIPTLYPVDGFEYDFMGDDIFDMELHGRNGGLMKGQCYHTLGTAAESKATPTTPKRLLRINNCVFKGSGALEIIQE